MTFKELQDDTLERTTFDSSVATSTARTRIKRFLNESYRRILRETGLGRLATSTATLTLVAGTAEYTVTGARVRMIYDATNGLVLREVRLSDIRELDPEASATGTPFLYAVTAVGASTVTVRLHPTPSAAGSLAADISGPITALSSDTDVPVVPVDFHYLIGAGARMLEAEKMQQFDNYNTAERELRAGIGKLRLHLAKSRRYLTDRQPSRLGPYYEANQ